MIKKITFVSAGLLLLVSPLIVSAQSAPSSASDTGSQLQALLAQIQSLRQQIQTLQEQIRSITTSSASSSGEISGGTPSPLPGGSVCFAPDRPLSFGSSDAQTSGQVSGLQNFLVGQGLMVSSNITGFFGRITENALQNWQSSHGIVSSGNVSSTGWGLLGPRTRAIIIEQCSGGAGPSSNPGEPGTTPSQLGRCPDGTFGLYPTCSTNSSDTSTPPSGVRLTASPLSGAAPLTVKFSGSVTGKNYTLDYGDGSAPALQMMNVDCTITSSYCAQNIQMPVDQTHTYTAAGTYVATLTNSSGNTLGTVMITVTGATTSSLAQ